MINTDGWVPQGVEGLEPNALKAVFETERSIVITAGPGAGKTELLAQRADFLLKTGVCAYPRRILAISFKVDAARNIGDRVRLRCGGTLAARFDSYTFHGFAKRLVDNYRVLLSGPNELDPDYTIDPTNRVARVQITYDDLINFALETLQKSAYARNSLRQTYSHVFLDEFQDATGPQYELLKSVFLDSGVIVTAVGDTKQRIMKFAGALEGIMKTFATDFSAQALTLYQNYRSAPVVRRMQNRMIKELEPGSAVPADELVGDDGHVEVLSFANDTNEAVDVATLVCGWLEAGVPATEIAILVRQQPHLICETLINELTERGVAVRNDQSRQDLTTEPAAMLVLNLIRVVTDSRKPESYEALMRVVLRSGGTEETNNRNMSEIGRFIVDGRRGFRDGTLDSESLEVWSQLVYEFLRLVTRPVITALSPTYHHGQQLDEVIKSTLAAFGEELSKDNDVVRALERLSELDAVRIMTIHKSKGLEFEKVILLGVEQECFWNAIDEARAEFFVAISRAKKGLYLTTTKYRARPVAAPGRWDEARRSHREFLGYAIE